VHCRRRTSAGHCADPLSRNSVSFRRHWAAHRVVSARENGRNAPTALQLCRGRASTPPASPYHFTHANLFRLSAGRELGPCSVMEVDRPLSASLAQSSNIPCLPRYLHIRVCNDSDNREALRRAYSSQSLLISSPTFLPLPHIRLGWPTV
jgi:hypothetical protein